MSELKRATNDEGTSSSTPAWVRPVIVIAVLLAVVAILKGVRMPGRWAATHYTFNYSRGFIRRGLFGEILRHIFGARAYHYSTVVAVAVTLFGAFVALMTRLVVHTARGSIRDVGFWAAIFVFLASPGLVLLAHVIGYLDYVGINLELVVLLFVLKSARMRAWLVPIVLVVSIVLALIHESSLILFMPVFVFMVICDIHARSQWGMQSTGWRRRVQQLGPALVVVVAAAASILIGDGGTRPRAFVDLLQKDIERSVDFPLRPDAFEVLFQSVMKNLLEVMPHYWSYAESQRVLLHGALATAPGLAYLIAYGIRLIGGTHWTRGRVGLAVAFVGATLSPVLMNFVGWDHQRWNALATFSCFVCVCVLKQTTPVMGTPEKNASEISPWLLCLAAAAMVIGLCSEYQYFLFDGYKVHWFPFDDRGSELLDLFTRSPRFIPPN